MSKRLRSSEVCADCSGPGESPWPGPLLSALLAETPYPGAAPSCRACSRKLSPATGGFGLSEGKGETKAGGRGRWHSFRVATGLGPVRARRAGGRRPLVLSFPVVPSVPGGPGRLLEQEGAWAVHGQARDSSRTRAAAPGGCRCHLSSDPRPDVGGSPDFPA